MRWDSPPVLVVVGTLAVHTLLLTAGDAVATYTRSPPEPAPHFDLFEIEEPPPPPAPPPPPQTAPPDPVPPPAAPKAPPVAHVQPSAPRAVTAPPREPPTEPPTTAPPATPGARGDGPILPMGDIAPSARGIAIPRGGHGGAGGGTGSGTGPAPTGAGSGSAGPAPMSVATIKTRALPRGDYSYFGAGKDYPAEAKTLAIEGTIRVRLVVDAEGKVASAVPLNHLGHGLDELADRYAHAIVFDPARATDDRPVASVVVWTFQFTLPH